MPLRPLTLVEEIATHVEVLADAEAVEDVVDLGHVADPQPCELLERQPVISAPLSSTRPASTRAMPRIAFSRVLFPAPLGPTTATT